jgi:hypothetical protein
MIANKLLIADTAPDCDATAAFNHQVNTLFRTCGYTRAAIATRMNEALNAHECIVTAQLLNKWFSPNDPKQMPVQYLPALMWAVKSAEPANVLLAPLDLIAASPHGEQIALKTYLEAQLAIVTKDLETQGISPNPNTTDTAPNAGADLLSLLTGALTNA